MYEVSTPTATTTIPRDIDPDMALAEGAAQYLTRNGLDHQAIVRCLVEEFELDRATAEALADLAA